MSQTLALMVRYYDSKKCKVTDALLNVIEIDEASAENLYKALKTLLVRENYTSLQYNWLCK